MYSSAECQAPRIHFSRVLERYAGTLACPPEVPRSCAGLGQHLQRAPSTIQRRTHRLMAGQPLRTPGRPRVWTPRAGAQLRQRLATAEARVAAAEEQARQAHAATVHACARQSLVLFYHATSVREAAECLAAAWPDAPGKSALAETWTEFIAVAKELFLSYCAGRGLVAAGDEIYFSGHPCLELVEPRSLAVTGLRPDTPPTCAAWRGLLETFPVLEAGVSDQGRGVSQALGEKAARYSLDKWHLLRHFAAAVGRLEAEAYLRIAAEYQSWTALLARMPYAPGAAAPPEYHRWTEAQARMERAIRDYDSAHLVCGWLYEAAEPVDAQGRVRTPAQIAGDWEAALLLVNYLPQTLEKPAEALLDKMDGRFAQGLAERLARIPLPAGWTEPEREELQRWTCQAWRLHHRRHTHLLRAPLLAAADWAAAWGAPALAERCVPYVDAVFRVLDATPSASSAVECVNSIFRQHEGAKRHPHPDFPYLLAWLHNTRAFTEGRRRGHTPLELLGVALPQHGWEMLLERVQERRQARRRTPCPRPAATPQPCAA